MADALTEFLFNNIKDIVVRHATLISDAKVNAEELQNNLGIFNAFLRDVSKLQKKDDRTKQTVKDIHNVVYEVEDIIDFLVTKTKETRHKGVFFDFWNKATSLHTVGKKIEAIKDKVELCWKEIGLVGHNEEKQEKPEPRPPRKKDVVGFVDVTEDLIRRLLQKTDHFYVISLIGMFGLGKSTLAWKILHDPRIICNIPTRIWLSISKQFTDKEIFFHILEEVGIRIDDDIRAKEDHVLADMVSDALNRGNFLIVMDDVWTTADWERLRVALPHDINRKGKVLITSRDENVGKFASKPGYLCKLREFSFEESWELLQLEALGTLNCPTELEDDGQKIARDCDGLPLTIVVIGGILATKTFGSNMTATRKAWGKVSTRLSSYIKEENKGKGYRIQKLISLSYDELPYHLRACFLYLGLFPEDHEIPASKLIRMWIAEGFIQEKADFSLEETGETYLGELINRNLVKGVKFKLDGKVKVCQIHDTLRDFCLTEAESENFLQEIKYNSNGQCVPSPSELNTYRRLSLHSRCLEFIQAKPFGPRVRSFVCFPKDKYEVSAENSTKIIGAFKLLRVLDVLSFRFAVIDKDLYKLIHVRYLALSSKSSSLHSNFSKLLNIQTFIVDTTSPTLQVEAEIWKMKYLRHFKTNASAILRKSTTNERSAELQTLGLISVESCTDELCDRAPNLKKLGIRGKLLLLFSGTVGSFSSLRRMTKLEKLKLKHDPYPIPPSEGGLDYLPQHDLFPSHLTTLTLCGTYLSWKHMSTLASLEKLEVLKLKDHAFMGDTWREEGRGFHCLELLHIDQTNLRFWSASSLSYPKLRSLVLKNCEQLSGIPFQLADISNLQILELYTCAISAVKSAKKISEAKKKTLPEASAFRLSIYPPTE